MTMNEATPRLGDDVPGLLYRVGELIVQGPARTDRRLDRLETDVKDLKTDVAGLKTDVAGLRRDLNANTRANEKRFDRVDAKFDQLIGLITRAELKPPPNDDRPQRTDI